MGLEPLDALGDEFRSHLRVGVFGMPGHEVRQRSGWAGDTIGCVSQHVDGASAQVGGPDTFCQHHNLLAGLGESDC